jgi:hypothetical protein
MRIWTVHLHPYRTPVLVPETFSWGAALFGPLWLFARRAWVGGVLALAAAIALGLAPIDPAVRGVTGLALAWLLGLWGQDLRRWSLSRRGYTLAHVVAAPSADAATLRLAEQRPDFQQDAPA